MGDFIFLCLKDTTISPSNFYKNVLNGDNYTTSYIKSLEKMNNINDDVINNRFVASEMINLNNDVVNCELIPYNLKVIFNDFDISKYPSSIKDLKVNGNDLMEIGIYGEKIKKYLNKILYLIYSDILKNDKKSIISYLLKKSKIK